MNAPLDPPAFARLSASAEMAKVTLVGAGPGDPDLLTVKAARAIAQASTVLYDHLVGPDVLGMLPPGADRIYVGKRGAQHAMEQGAIIELMITLARAGKPVLRLKGGDPYIFGRGGEEAQALVQAGVPFEMIPGISAAQGTGPAGIPLTHRDHARAVVFATGHLREDRREGRAGEAVVDLDWVALARPLQTVVIYMGVGALPVICSQLIAHGLSAETPAATVERATRPDQRVLTGTLASLPALAVSQRVQAPALIVIGSVVTLHSELVVPCAQSGCFLEPVQGHTVGDSLALRAMH